ncbi:regulator of nonsense transcripts UPF3-like [Iris pallida]|uniref:Regulator of nonsense transcripts UPF3-like n=1 Tax=Iris pallida TaxID=29817 RepID=A0AAX6FJ47_IRIPA|nr:regulator of nonsense transcripts UPF3-like [Iris pallida]
MKDPLNKTKVVVRHLPPAISEPVLRDQIDGRFSGRYKWFSFRPGKNSQKNQRYSRAYIDFLRPEDVIEFAEFFNGHIFVNEKGAQLKALVEYAPSQHVPKVWSKKDGREGTILKDPEYLEFLELIAKPAENLPSAEIQLERKEAERSGRSKETLIVTPLMDFVRQKRAAKSGSQRSSINGKLSRRSGAAVSSSSSPSSKRGSEKRRGSTSMYVLRDSTKSSSGKDKSTYMLVPRKEEQKLPFATGEVPENETVTASNGNTPTTSGSIEIGRRRLVLLKGKESETTQVSGGSSQQQTATSSRNFTRSTPKQSQRQETGGKIIRTILSNKDARQGQSSLSAASEQQIVNLERDKRPPRYNPRQILKDHITVTKHASVSDSDGKISLDDKVATIDLHGSLSVNEKNERRTRNKDRPDRGVWTPLRRSDGTHASDDSFSSPQLLSEGFSISQQVGADKDVDDEISSHSTHGGRGSNSLSAYDVASNHGETKSNRITDIKILASGRANISTIENGSHRHVGRRGMTHGMKDADGSTNHLEGKSSKRGGSVGYGPHEKQVWVQKSGPGS